MMQLIGTYVVSLTSAAILFSVLLSFFPEGTLRSLLTLCCGVIFTVLVLSPLPGLELPDLAVFAEGCFEEGQELARQSARQAEESRRQGIKSGLESYILDKAKALGICIQADVTADEEGSPQAVTVTGVWTMEQRRSLAAIITNDLGIPEEDQQWNARNGPTESETQLENTAGQP